MNRSEDSGVRSGSPRFSQDRHPASRQKSGLRIRARNPSIRAQRASTRCSNAETRVGFHTPDKVRHQKTTTDRRRPRLRKPGNGSADLQQCATRLLQPFQRKPCRRMMLLFQAACRRNGHERQRQHVPPWNGNPIRAIRAIRGSLPRSCDSDDSWFPVGRACVALGSLTARGGSLWDDSGSTKPVVQIKP